MSKREEYIAKIKAELDELNEDLGKLEARAKEASESARAKYEEQMKEVRGLAAELRTELDKVRAAGEQAWNDLTEEVERVRKALVHSFNYFKSQLK